MMYVEFMKNFLLADVSELMAIRLIWPPEPKNVQFLLSRHDVRRVDEKLSRRTSCLESRNETFLGSGGRNESNSQWLARIGEKKIYLELGVHHV